MWVGEGWTDRLETMKLSCSCLAVTHRSHDICVKICRLYKMNKDLFVSCGVWMKNNTCMGPWMTPRHHYWPCWCFFFFLPPDFSCLRVSHSSDSSFLLKSWVLKEVVSHSYVSLFPLYVTQINRSKLWLRGCLGWWGGPAGGEACGPDWQPEFDMQHTQGRGRDPALTRGPRMLTGMLWSQPILSVVVQANSGGRRRESEWGHEGALQELTLTNFVSSWDSVFVKKGSHSISGWPGTHM